MTSTPELLTLLDEAVHLASQFTGGYSNHFIGAEAFHAALQQSVHDFKNGDHSRLDELWLWFAPTCDWDDFIVQDGCILGNNIFEMLNDLRNQQKISRH